MQLSRRIFQIAVTVAAATAQTSQGTFEGQPAVLLSNDKLQVTVLTEGSTIASIVLHDDAERLNPLWNPLSVARESGQPAQFNGTLGHFLCVDGFGQPSAEERAAGLPTHGEAHLTRFSASVDEGAHSVTMTASLPIAQEVFTRTIRTVNGENVVYVDSQLENLLGFDRPVNWAEHATVAAPFLEPGVTTVALSGTRSQNRPWTAPGRANGPGRGNNQPTQRRLVSGADFTWPMAPGLDGNPVDLHVIPDNPHYLDHAATLLDPSRKLEWVAAFNARRRVIYGYIFRREDYPWLQHWGNYPAVSQLVRGLEFGTQPYDVSRRESVTTGSMFGTPTYRWLPAKSKITTRFILFYAHVPEGLQNIEDVRLENGSIVIEDRSASKQMTLAASRGL